MARKEKVREIDKERNLIYDWKNEYTYLEQESVK